jgi:O-antigen polymerase
MGFGLTQVFFSHNSGNLFYLFMLALLHGALLELARASNQVQSNGCQWRMQRALPA